MSGAIPNLVGGVVGLMVTACFAVLFVNALIREARGETPEDTIL